MVETEEEERNKVLDLSVEELDLSVRSFNCLKGLLLTQWENLFKNRS